MLVLKYCQFLRVQDVEAAKRQVEDAMMAVLQKHNTYEDAVF